MDTKITNYSIKKNNKITIYLRRRTVKKIQIFIYDMKHSGVEFLSQLACTVHGFPNQSLVTGAVGVGFKKKSICHPYAVRDGKREESLRCGSLGTERQSFRESTLSLACSPQGAILSP